MKKIVEIIGLMSIALAFVACGNNEDYNNLLERIDALENRIENLEVICGQNNTNISSLQTLLDAQQTGDVVTNVIPVIQDGDTIGYTVTFGQTDPITIYNGKNGESGAPNIGVRQDSDGYYYWTIDGEWLTDENGAKQRVTGKDGENGVTPRMEIRDGYWYVSLDNGATWTECGKATGEKGQDADSMFTSVTYDEEYVYFTLADGTIIKIAFSSKN